jgi:hypothetical protein
MRDLDEMLDPVVSRRASGAARPPDFAALERRARQRRRRTRAMTVGAVVVVAAAVSVVGTQVMSDRVDTAPAGTIQYDGRNGELARAIRSGAAAVEPGVALGADGSVLTVWRRVESPDHPDRPTRRGFTVAVDGTTHWSPLAYHDVQAAELADGSFIVAVTEDASDTLPTYYIADADRLRPLELATTPLDPGDGGYDGVAVLQSGSVAGTVYAIDTETASASPFRQLDGVVADARTSALEVARSADGGFWIVDASPDPDELLNLTPDGRVARYPLPIGMEGALTNDDLTLSVSTDGRPVLLWTVQHYDAVREKNTAVVRLSTVGESGISSPTDVATAGALADPSVASLPGGRLLIKAGDRLLASTDSTWREFTEVAGPAEGPRDVVSLYRMVSGDGGACLTPTGAVSAYFFTYKAASYAYCTSDGESWEPLALTPEARH